MRFETWSMEMHVFGICQVIFDDLNRPPETDEKVPIAQPPDAVRQRNSLRASLRGEALRSSMLYHSPAQLRRLGSRRAGATAENVKLRRVYTR